METMPSYSPSDSWTMAGAIIPPRLWPMRTTFSYPMPFRRAAADTASSTVSYPMSREFPSSTESHG